MKLFWGGIKKTTKAGTVQNATLKMLDKLKANTMNNSPAPPQFSISNRKISVTSKFNEKEYGVAVEKIKGEQIKEKRGRDNE